MTQRVVILGGGFGGFYSARALERLSSRSGIQVTLISDVNFMLFTPLLPGAAAGTLEPRHVVVSLRESLRSTRLVLASVSGLDPDGQTVSAVTPDGRRLEIVYDQLLVALGSVSRILPIPGLAEHGMGLKSLADAIQLRNHVLQTLEIAETIDDEAERGGWLTYVFVGAGYAGLEGLAELQDFASELIEHYPHSRATGMRWILVEAREQVLPEIGEKLGRFAASELQARGIEIHTNTTLDAVTADTVEISGSGPIPARTLVWTAGVAPVPVTRRLGLPLDDGGRITAGTTLQVSGRPNVFAIGDIAAVPDPARPGSPCPPTAQHAMRQGMLAARNIVAASEGRPAEHFRYKTRGVFVDMGQGRAVANAMGIRLRGIPAWWLARTYHLYLMPGIKRRWRLLVDWNVQLLFGRDAAELGSVGHARKLGDES